MEFLFPGAIPAGSITGLTSTQILFGSSSGGIQQDAAFTYNAVSGLLTAPQALFTTGLESRGSGGSTSLRAGGSSVASNINTTALGASTNATGNGATAIGAGANATGGGATALGASSAANQTGGIALGNGASVTAANQCVIGGPSNFLTYVSNLYIGSGVTDSTPQAANIRGTGGSGANVAGVALGLISGLNTGNANPAPITFSTGVSGASGSTLSAAVERARITPNSNFLLATTSESTASNSLVLGSSGFNDPAVVGTNFFLGAINDGGGNVILCLASSEVVGASVATPANVKKYRMRVNGTFQNFLVEG